MRRQFISTRLPSKLTHSNNPMQQEQLKTLLVNIITGVVVLAVLVAGYFVFVKKEVATTLDDAGTPSVKTDAQTTVLVGIEISRTVKVLEELKQSVIDSAEFFNRPEFNNLEDFSVVVLKGEVGRENPFSPTAWKLKIKALEESASKASAKGSGGQEASIIRQIQEQLPTDEETDIVQTPAGNDLLGDFPPDDAS